MSWKFSLHIANLNIIYIKLTPEQSLRSLPGSHARTTHTYSHWVLVLRRHYALLVLHRRRRPWGRRNCWLPWPTRKCRFWGNASITRWSFIELTRAFISAVMPPAILTRPTSTTGEMGVAGFFLFDGSIFTWQSKCGHEEATVSVACESQCRLWEVASGWGRCLLLHLALLSDGGWGERQGWVWGCASRSRSVKTTIVRTTVC
jgi:hypothetical protein